VTQFDVWAPAAAQVTAEICGQPHEMTWSELDRPRHRLLLAWYRQLIALRRGRPELTDPRLDRVSARWDSDDRWIVISRSRLRIAAKLAAVARELPAEDADGPGGAVLAASTAGIKTGAGVIQLPPASFAVVLT
jgi:maltooligosyltrehalose trehalohydrolase